MQIVERWREEPARFENLAITARPQNPGRGRREVQRTRQSGTASGRDLWERRTSSSCFSP